MTTYYSSFYPVESADGAKGSAAFIGAISTTIIYLYRRSATLLTDADKPNGSSIYTFSTAFLDITEISNGWTKTIPTGTDPIYVIAATATGTDATDTIGSAEWSTPVILAQNGVSGMNTATIFLFKRSNNSTPPAAPSQMATYTFSSGILIGTSSAGNTISPFLDGWSQTAPDSSGGKYLFVTTATAISSSATDTITTSEWATVRTLAQDGAMGYTAYLTNETHTLLADSVGNVSSYTGATGNFKVFLDGVGDISSSFTLSTFSNPQALTITYSTNTYTVSGGFDVAEDVATVTIRATGSGTYSGVVIDKVFSLSKSKAGSNGSSAKSISIAVDRQLISYDGAGLLTPTTQTTTFSITKQSTTVSITWTVQDTLGNNLVANSYLSSDLAGTTATNTGDIVYMTAAKFQSAISVNGAQGLIITATATDGVTLTDKVTIMKVKAGADGSNGTPGAGGLSGILTNESFTTTSASDGTGYTLTSAGGTFRVYSGSSEVTTSSAFSVVGSATLNGLTIAINASTGVYSLSGASWTSDTETFTLQAVYSGGTLTKTYKISKVKSGASGSSAVSYSITPSVSSIRKDNSGILSPTSVTFSATSTTGTGAPVTYAGRFIIATSVDGATFTDQYTSAANESSRVYTIPAGITYIRARLYLAGGTATQVDQQTVIVLTDGSVGSPGQDAVIATLTNDAQSLFSYADGTVVSFVSANGLFRIYKGSTDVTSSADNFAATASGCTGTINTAANTPVSGQPVGYYQVTAMSGDTATLTLSARYPAGAGGTTYTKIYTLSKTKGGYEIVSVLPTTNLFQGRVIFLTTDNKLYRYSGTAWVTSVASTDISGTLADAQIAAVAASKITGQLSDTQLAAISAAKITGTITDTQITDGAITTAKISAGAITSNEIAANTIVAADIAAGTITGTQIAANTITAAKIAAGTITATEIAANTITAAKIAADTITANEIASNAITANELSAGSVTAAKISVTSLSAITATIGTLRTATSGARTEISDNVIKVYDSSNVLRVKIGDLSL